MDSLKHGRLTNLQKLLAALSPDVTPSEAETICTQILFLKSPDYLFKSKAQILKAVKDLPEYREALNLEIKVDWEENDVCPVTRMALVQPVTGKCGHRFEKSIYEDLRARKHKCPVVGCGKDI